MLRLLERETEAPFPFKKGPFVTHSYTYTNTHTHTHTCLQRDKEKREKVKKTPSFKVLYFFVSFHSLRPHIYIHICECVCVFRCLSSACLVSLFHLPHLTNTLSLSLTHSLFLVKYVMQWDRRRRRLNDFYSCSK